MSEQKNRGAGRPPRGNNGGANRKGRYTPGGTSRQSEDSGRPQSRYGRGSRSGENTSGDFQAEGRKNNAGDANRRDNAAGTERGYRGARPQGEGYRRDNAAGTERGYRGAKPRGAGPRGGRRSGRGMMPYPDNLDSWKISSGGNRGGYAALDRDADYWDEGRQGDRRGASRRPAGRPPRQEQAVQAEPQPERDDLLAGRNAVWEALKAGKALERIYLAQGVDETALQGILGVARREKVKVDRVPRTKLDEIVGDTKHQGVVALLSAMEYTPLEQLLDDAFAKGQDPLFVLLDEVQDPHNLGAIIRTADCAGASGVIIMEHRAVGLTTTVAKVSAGALAHMPVAKVTNLARAMELLKKRGVILFGADMEGKSCYACDFTGPLGLVIGNEGVGLRRLVREQCDQLAGIPIYGHVDSLNASVAAAVMMFEAVRQRQNPR